MINYEDKERKNTDDDEMKTAAAGCKLEWPEVAPFATKNWFLCRDNLSKVKEVELGEQELKFLSLISCLGQNQSHPSQRSPKRNGS